MKKKKIFFFDKKRFFGRLANENAIHDEETLKAIKENTDGLKSIEKQNLINKKKIHFFFF